MSIVFVCSPSKLELAIADYQQSLAAGQVDHQIAMLALIDFVKNAEQARWLFHRATQIYSFTLENFLEQLDKWCIQEQARCPNQKGRISLAGDTIHQLFRSSWPVDYNLIVRELLTGTEVYESYP